MVSKTAVSEGMFELVWLEAEIITVTITGTSTQATSAWDATDAIAARAIDLRGVRHGDAPHTREFV